MENGYVCFLSLEDFRRIKALVRKCRVHVRVLRRYGVPFLLSRYRKRKFLFAALVMSAALVFLLSRFIWDIRIEGNHSITDSRIVGYLLKNGIRQGTWKSAIDYKQLSADLRSQFPEITWVSVKLQGTRLLIDLQENTDPAILENGTYEPSDLISDVDGVVVRIVTRSGTPQVAEGDAVSKGDLLVSGRIELVDDAGQVYDHQYTAADADVYIKTEVSYRDRILAKQKKKEYTGKTISRYLMRFGPFRAGIPIFRNPYPDYDCLETEKQLRIAENFYLPVYFSKISVQEYEIKDFIYTQKQLEEQAAHNLDQFLKNFQEKGVQIFQNDVKIDTTDSMCTVSGTVFLIEKAGKRAGTERIETQREGTNTE